MNAANNGFKKPGLARIIPTAPIVSYGGCGAFRPSEIIGAFGAPAKSSSFGANRKSFDALQEQKGFA